MPTISGSGQSFICSDTDCPLCGGTTTINIAPPVRPAARPTIVPPPAPPSLSYAERNTINSVVDIASSSSEEGVFRARANCACEACKHMRREGSSLRESVVHEYSYEPGAWTPKRLPRDPDNFFFGVELETDRRPSGNGLTNQYAAGMRRPDRFWVAKRDGSVSGPEFASYPATMGYWKSHYDDFAEMFRMLVHAGFRSHDGGNAGMHVNVSKVAFNDGSHLARFMHLVHYSHNWSLIMSQRTNGQAGQWCGLNEWNTYSEMLYRADAVMSDGRYYSNKYSAVNTPVGEARVEFRLPRGTLRIDRFFKNLEWTAGMVEFTRGMASHIEAVPENFMSWVEDNVSTYPNLFSFLNERASGLVLAARDVNVRN
jgi:hypothetical protein